MKGGDIFGFLGRVRLAGYGGVVLQLREIISWKVSMDDGGEIRDQDSSANEDCRMQSPFDLVFLQFPPQRSGIKTKKSRSLLFVALHKVQDLQDMLPFHTLQGPVLL